MKNDQLYSWNHNLRKEQVLMQDLILNSKKWGEGDVRLTPVDVSAAKPEVRLTS